MSKVFNLSNCLSASRAFFALVFLWDNTYARMTALILAMLSDFLDGYLARRQHTESSFGAILDPIMDKFFVFFVGIIFYIESRLSGLDLIALLSRDISLLCFGVYLLAQKGWRGYEFKAIWWGKITTAAQFFLLIGLSAGYRFPRFVYLIFVVMAAFAFLELVSRFQKKNGDAA